MQAPLKAADGLFDIEVPTRFHKQIRSGNCVCVVKRGRRSYRLGNNTAGCSLTGDGMNIEITTLRICKVASLHMGDAKASGFRSERDLKIFLKSVYEDLDPGDEVTQVHFKWHGDIKRSVT